MISCWYKESVGTKRKVKGDHKDGITNYTYNKTFAINEQIPSFSPCVVPNTINYLVVKKKFNEPDLSVFFPCTGFGGLVVGALAHPWVSAITANEPVENLCTAYQKFQQFYKSNKPLFVSSKMLEDIASPEEIMPGNRKHKLIIVSPPYRDRILYVSSKSMYADDGKWSHFINALLNTCLSLDWGGFFVLNVARIEKYDLLQDFKLAIENSSVRLNIKLEDEVFATTRGRGAGRLGKFVTDKEVFLFVRRQANLGAPSYSHLSSDDHMEIVGEDGDSEMRVAYEFAETSLRETGALGLPMDFEHQMEIAGGKESGLQLDDPSKPDETSLMKVKEEFELGDEDEDEDYSEPPQKRFRSDPDVAFFARNSPIRQQTLYLTSIQDEAKKGPIEKRELRR